MGIITALIGCSAAYFCDVSDAGTIIVDITLLKVDTSLNTNFEYFREADYGAAEDVLACVFANVYRGLLEYTGNPP